LAVVSVEKSTDGNRVFTVNIDTTGVARGQAYAVGTGAASGVLGPAYASSAWDVRALTVRPVAIQVCLDGEAGTLESVTPRAREEMTLAIGSRYAVRRSMARCRAHALRYIREVRI
jgi:hypothetical protein